MCSAPWKKKTFIQRFRYSITRQLIKGKVPLIRLVLRLQVHIESSVSLPLHYMDKNGHLHIAPTGGFMTSHPTSVGRAPMMSSALLGRLSMTFWNVSLGMIAHPPTVVLDKRLDLQFLFNIFSEVILMGLREVRVLYRPVRLFHTKLVLFFFFFKLIEKQSLFRNHEAMWGNKSIFKKKRKQQSDVK